MLVSLHWAFPTDFNVCRGQLESPEAALIFAIGSVPLVGLLHPFPVLPGAECI